MKTIKRHELIALEEPVRKIKNASDPDKTTVITYNYAYNKKRKCKNGNVEIKEVLLMRYGEKDKYLSENGDVIIIEDESVSNLSIPLAINNDFVHAYDTINFNNNVNEILSYKQYAKKEINNVNAYSISVVANHLRKFNDKRVLLEKIHTDDLVNYHIRTAPLNFNSGYYINLLLADMKYKESPIMKLIDSKVFFINNIENIVSDFWNNIPYIKRETISDRVFSDFIFALNRDLANEKILEYKYFGFGTYVRYTLRDLGYIE